MNYRIDTLHRRGGKECYIVSKFLNSDGSLTINLFPGKVFNTKDAAIEATKNYKED